MTKNLNPSFNELHWVIQIRRSMDEDVEDDGGIPVSIFNVPKTLISNYPNSFIPHQVALGPYHHLRPELCEMARYKASAAKRFQKQLHDLRFPDVVNHLTKQDLIIRAYYHKYLDFNVETLAWMMAVDASFMLEFLDMHAIKDSCYIFDYIGRKFAHNEVLRDMVMLENQIPLLVLRKMLEFQYPSLEKADEVLNSMLKGLYKELSPFNMINSIPIIHSTNYAHLLDFFYQTIIPKSEEPFQVDEDDHIIPISDEPFIDELHNSVEHKEESHAKLGYLSHLFKKLWVVLLKLIRYLLKYVQLRPVRLLRKLPWMTIVRLPGFAILRKPVEYFFSSDDKTDTETGSERENSTSKSNIPPLMEEIKIPSVSELHKMGVQFSPTKGGINSISFDEKTITLYLPIVRLDVQTEVIFRNLVAYEASSTASGPLIFTRYTELMNGIIDTEEDAKLLREKGIVVNHLKSDMEVAELWNGMTHSLSLTKVPFLDKVIEDVNKYYGGRWKVKVGKFMKCYVFESWQLLTFLATIVLLVLMCVQAFCSVYSCSVNNVTID